MVVALVVVAVAVAVAVAGIALSVITAYNIIMGRKTRFRRYE